MRWSVVTSVCLILVVLPVPCELQSLRQLMILLVNMVGMSEVSGMPTLSALLWPFRFQEAKVYKYVISNEFHGDAFYASA